MTTQKMVRERRPQTVRSTAVGSSTSKSRDTTRLTTRGQVMSESLSDLANNDSRVRQLSSLTNHVNRKTQGRPGVNATEMASSYPIQRYYALNQDVQANLNVSMQQGTVFPGHETSDENPDFLKSDRSVNRVIHKDMPDLAVSDDGLMAIENTAVNGSREVESFFADSAVVKSANVALESVKSKIDLKPVVTQSIEVPDLDRNTLHKLIRIIPQQSTHSSDDRASNVPQSEEPSGSQLLAPEQCVEFAQDIIGKSGLVLKIADSDLDIYNANNMREIMIQFLAGYLLAASKDGQSVIREKKQQDYISSAIDKARTSIQYAIVKRSVTEQFVTLQVYAGNRSKCDEALVESKQADELILKEEPMGSDWQYSSGYLGWAIYRKRFRVTHPKDSSNENLKSIIEKRMKDIVSAVDVNSLMREFGVDEKSTGKNMDLAMDGVLNNQVLNSGLIDEANRFLCIDEYAQPSVGGAYMIFHKATVKPDQNFPYHFAAVVAKSGVDSITLENYARDRHENDTRSSNRMYFQMYGPKRSVDFQDGKLKPLSKVKGDNSDSEANEYREGSFHSRWASIFSSPSTVTVKKRSME